MARRRLPLVVGVSVLFLMTAACIGQPVSTPTTRIELTVYAASSLKRALDAAASAYRLVAPDVTLVIATGSSTALRTQIEAGARADLFLGAEAKNAAALFESGNAEGEPVAFAANSLTLAVPQANPLGLTSPTDLARPGVRIIAAGEGVPITHFADAIVAILDDLPDYPAGYAASYAENVVSREDDAAAVTGKLVIGEGDAAFVYASDALANGLPTLPLPDAANVAAAYVGVVVAGAPHGAEAMAFLDWLRGPDGQAIFTRLGFDPVP